MPSRTRHPAATLVGTPFLAHPHLLVEIEVEATAYAGPAALDDHDVAVGVAAALLARQDVGVGVELLNDPVGGSSVHAADNLSP